METRKIVINTAHGGFGLSKEAVEMYCAIEGIDPGDWQYDYLYFKNFHEHDLKRDDPTLISVVEQLGAEACSTYSELKIIEIPVDVNWSIHEYDGAEWIAEVHRTWS